MCSATTMRGSAGLQTLSRLEVAAGVGYKGFVASRRSTADTRTSARSRSEYQSCLAILRETRVKAGVSQNELARRLGRPQSWVEKCESGARRVDFVELIQIAKALDVSPVTILQACRKKLSE